MVEDISFFEPYVSECRQLMKEMDSLLLEAQR